ncbi:unnamed protein product, partial [Discosporangium mesarthrocarpum]
MQGVEEPGAVAGSSGTEELGADLVLWTAGTKPSGVLGSLDLAKDRRGRVRVDSQLAAVALREEEIDGREGGG